MSATKKEEETENREEEEEEQAASDGAGGATERLVFCRLSFFLLPRSLHAESIVGDYFTRAAINFYFFRILYGFVFVCRST